MVQRIVLDDALLPQAQALSDEAGWNQNRADWCVFQRHGEVFGVQINDRLVATAVILPYGADFAWISMVLVTAAFRRRGLAKSLMRVCMARLDAQLRSALLDATEAGEPIYRALGFVTRARMSRWARAGGSDGADNPPPVGGEGWGRGAYVHRRRVYSPLPPNVDPLHGSSPQGEEEHPAITRLDAAAFGADRSFLLDDFLARSGARAWSEGESAVALRPGRNASHIGPIIGTARGAAPLLARAIDAAPGPVVIDLLDAGTDLAHGLARRGFTPRRDFCRMVLGRDTLPGTPARLLAAAGPEFG